MVVMNMFKEIVKEFFIIVFAVIVLLVAPIEIMSWYVFDRIVNDKRKAKQRIASNYLIWKMSWTGVFGRAKAMIMRVWRNW